MRASLWKKFRNLALESGALYIWEVITFEMSERG